MKRFAALFILLDEARSPSQKLKALAEYFGGIEPAEGACALSLLIGARPKRLLSIDSLKATAIGQTYLPEWLFEESQKAVGDLAETIALILPEPENTVDLPLSIWMRERIAPLASMTPERQLAVVTESWQMLTASERIFFNKLITGGYRAGVTPDLVVRGLAEAFGIPVSVIRHRLEENWRPTAAWFERLTAIDIHDAAAVRPKGFCRASPIPADLATLGDLADWVAEWKWDGIRAQLVRREGKCFLWTHTEALVTDRFPEIELAAAALPSDVVLDGEIVAWSLKGPASPGVLRARLAKKDPSKGLEGEIAFVVFDILECHGEDHRELPLHRRRARLHSLLESAFAAEFFAASNHPGLLRFCDCLMISRLVEASEWAGLSQRLLEARGLGAEGLVLKRSDAAYAATAEHWIAWDAEPFLVHAVLVYAERGPGGPTAGYVSYSFAVWRDEALITVAKVATGLHREDVKEIDAFIQANTLERIGPVRTVPPSVVVELTFEAVERSPRHKAGLLLRSPRVGRWVREVKPEDAHSVQALFDLIAG